MGKNRRWSESRRQKAAFLLWPAFLLSLVVLAGCGKKGPLKLEPKVSPTAIRDIRVRQIGNDLKLSWDFPQTLSDKKTRLDITEINRIRIRYAQGILTPKKFKKKSTLLMKLTPKETKTERRSFYITIPFKTRNLDKQAYSFAIRYVYRKDKSPRSPIVFIRTIAPVQPISDLSCTKENKVITLKWSRPRKNLKGDPVDVITGYRVYRKIGNGNYNRLNRENIINEYFQDQDTGRDGTYSYRVSTVSSDRIESGLSNPVSIPVKDIYPPDPPHNLILFRAEDHIFLTWNHVEDRDLDFYRVFRKTPSEDDFRLIAGEVRQNYHKDTDVQKGQSYVYFITAVDKKGNESQASKRVDEQF